MDIHRGAAGAQPVGTLDNRNLKTMPGQPERECRTSYASPRDQDSHLSHACERSPPFLRPLQPKAFVHTANHDGAFLPWKAWPSAIQTAMGKQNRMRRLLPYPLVSQVIASSMEVKNRVGHEWLWREL